MAGEVGIVGWAQTEHRSSMVRETHQTLPYRVVTEALKSCGMSIRDIDVVISAGSDFLDGRGISSCITVDAMGAQFKEEAKVAGDGMLAAVYAYMRVASGIFDTAIVVAYGKSSESSPRRQSQAMAEPFYLRPLGIDAEAAAALQEKSYLDHYGIEPEAPAYVVAKNRDYGVKNPYAQLREGVSVEEVLSSGDLVYPIRRLEASPVSDGACALILAGRGVADSLGLRPAWITGVGYCADAYYPGVRSLYRASSAQSAARAAYEQSGVEDPPGGIDIAELSEFYAYQELMLYEALGFCGEGEGVDFLRSSSGGGGAVTVNPSGGVLCANPLVATGLVRLVEAAAQVAGRAGDPQVPGAKRAVAHGGGGFAMQTAACVVVEG